LLHNVRQLVGQQPLPRSRFRRILAYPKDNVMAYRVSACIHGSGRFGCLRICMDAHLTEVAVKARLHQSPAPTSERLPRPKRGQRQRRCLSSTFALD
jgi:hypothetical protein